jgi:hypothetical protein
MSTQVLLVYTVLILLVTGMLLVRLRRMYQEVGRREEYDGRQKNVLRGQIGAMAVYLPVQMAALALPVADTWRGVGMGLAGLMLLLMGLSAARNRLMIPFNRGWLNAAPAAEGSTAVSVGVILMLLALVLFYQGATLLM